MSRIVLDPGHGGTKRVGGSSPNNAEGPTGLLEKTVTLDLALRVEPLLAAAGHEIILTRRTDVNLGLAERARVAKAAQADVFLAIHLNGFNRRAQGTETLCDLDHSPVSGALCLAVQKAVAAATGLQDRNRGAVKTQPLGVLKRASHASQTACCLTEVSFMDVAEEEARLKTEVYRQQIAKAIAVGIVAFLQTTARRMMMPAAPRAFEDGFAALAATAPARRRTTRKAGKTARGPRRVASNTLDRVEFAIVGIGEGFDATAKRARFRSLVSRAAADLDFKAFETFVGSLGLRYFSAEELLFLGASNASGPCAATNAFPPESLWKNIATTARMLDEIRHRLGAECRILSAYRSAAYNSCIGGEKKSLHMRFNAIDFRCAKGRSTDWHRVAVELRASNGKFLGGIGKYNSFLHIDTRGYKADW